MKNLKQAVVSALKILNPDGRTVGPAKPIETPQTESPIEAKVKFASPPS